MRLHPPPDGRRGREVTATEAVYERLTKLVLLSITEHVRTNSYRPILERQPDGRLVDTGKVELDLDLLVPEEVDFELLVWDMAISLEVNTLTHDSCTVWVGKIGEGRRSRFGWHVTPLPYLLEF